jgi:hypothetical protein
VKNGSRSRHDKEGKPHAIRDNYKGYSHSGSASRALRHHYSPTHSSMKFYAHEESRSNPEVSHVGHQRRRYESDILQGELRKINPPTFDGENRKGDDAKTWLLEIRKYFWLHNVTNINIYKYVNINKYK